MAGFDEVAIRYGIPDERRPQYLFSDEQALMNHLRSLLAHRRFTRSPLSSTAIQLVWPGFSRSGLGGAIAPGLFLKGVWNDD